MKRSPNFTARITSPDFSFENGDWLKCSRLKIAIDVAGREGIGSVSGCILECAPMANGKLELRIWIGDKYYRKQFTVFGGLIDWSVVDGRRVSKEEKQANKARVRQARSILKKKTRKRLIRVRPSGLLTAGANCHAERTHQRKEARKNVRHGVEAERDKQRREGALLSQEASDTQIGRASVSDSGEGQERTDSQGVGSEKDEGAS